MKVRLLRGAVAAAVAALAARAAANWIERRPDPVPYERLRREPEGDGLVLFATWAGRVYDGAPHNRLQIALLRWASSGGWPAPARAESFSEPPSAANAPHPR